MQFRLSQSLWRGQTEFISSPMSPIREGEGGGAVSKRQEDDVVGKEEP